MRKLGMLVVVAGLMAFSAPAWAGDGYGKKLKGDHSKCACSGNTARTVSWCGPCKSGVAFGQTIKSEKLVAALAGHEVKADGMKCSGCKAALKTSGKCEHCKVGFRNGMSFHSPVSLALAKGELVDAEKIECPRCKTIAKEGKGECTNCKVGVVAGMMFKDKEDFVWAKKAGTILASAIKAYEKCEGCAVAMVSDGACEHCKVSFKGGEKVAKGTTESKSGY